jgi:hypothetical protein
MIDSLVQLLFNIFSFRLVFLDFNFDGVNDVFMQSTCSNGYTICRSLLFEFDPIEKVLILHPEVKEFGNYRVDKDKRVLIA